ncbi:hypothetical protein EV127DRAFT_444656 [Xylaria flabelliformis]|nr:hypothetical protein EV127DRAFT_444656 [Xylaria flabelliformis]
MTDLNFRDATAIVQLAFFAFYLAGGLFLCHKHGWHRAGGWSIVVIFSLLRLTGASFQLATISHPTRAIYAGALVTESIGIAPLIGISAGMLGRLNGWLYKPIPRLYFSLIFAASLTGIGLASGSAAITPPANSPSPWVPNGLTKAADAVFAAEFGATALIFFIILAHKIELPRIEVRLLWTIAAASPFVAVRLAFGLLFAFSGQLRFNILVGSTTIYLFMSVLPEIIAVGIAVLVGLTLPRASTPPSQATSKEEKKQKFRKQKFRG